MFNVKHNECIGFESRWTVKKVSLVGSTQTTEYSKTNMETNTLEQKSIEVQTDDPEPPSSGDFDEQKLADWLKRIYPQVKKELDKVANTKAFKGYRLSTDNSDANCRLVQSIDLTSQLKEADISSQVSALSWNSSSNTLAVSCVYNHTSWCYHEGFVAFYTLNSDDYLPELPKIKLTAESCVMNLQFHPVLPAVIAGSLYSGGIIIWNIQHEECEVIVKVNGHGDGITQLSWITDINSPKTYLLASSSLDGHLTTWNFSHSSSTLTIKEQYQIKSPLLPRSSDGEKVIKQVVRGVLSFDFSKHVQDMFLVGAEGGLVVQCSVLGTSPLKSSDEEVPLSDPAVKYYQPHQGEIISVKFSPNRKDMFMTHGSDSEIRIYMIGQDEPAQVIFLKSSLNTVSWIPYEEKIIAGCGSKGLVEIFHLIRGKAFENITKEKVEIKMLTRMEINNAKAGIVAIGTENGRIQMWRVPWGIFGNMTIQ